MHTVTFYSFKGGVGRTLAMVNIGVELANSGKKVLMVDFDLEAPGIDTFAELSPSSPNAGIVDYVTHYLSHGTTPDLKSFVYQADLPLRQGGTVWVMPAGRRDASYGAKLASIDWQDLYSNRDGFFLLEDLKLRWAEDLRPDYVLVDSRTGHTEVGGICTRQLPDTVAVFFVPNEQNLSGLTGIVQAIRDEEKRSSGRKINLEFVASNVPNLDDEEEILHSMLRRFSRTLGYDKATTIERYDSLHLLNQSIFVTSRPKSRLSKQYRRLLQQIVEHNLEDREAALRVLSRSLNVRDSWLNREHRSSKARSDVSSQIQTILQHHQDDPEILWATGMLYRQQGKVSDSISLLDRSATIGYRKQDPSAARYLLDAADVHLMGGGLERVAANLWKTLQSENLGAAQVCRVISLARQADLPPWTRFSETPAVKTLTLEERAEVAEATSFSREWQEVGLEVLEKGGLREVGPEKWSVSVCNQLSLLSIGAGRFEMAVEAFNRNAILSGTADIADTFNYAMAEWGLRREKPIFLMQRVVELGKSQQRKNANFEQCVALAYFLTGHSDVADERLQAARQLASQIPVNQFSCWSYLNRDPDQFQADLAEMEQFFAGNAVLPRFMTTGVSEQVSSGNIVPVD